MSLSASSSGELEAVVTVLDLVREGAATTRPEISQVSGLGRNVVAQRVAQLLDSRLLVDGRLGPSTGGRAPRELRFNAEAGHILVAELGATTISVGIVNLAGDLVGPVTEASDVADGPSRVLGRVEQLFDEALERHPVEVWGVGIGVPGPVEFTSGRLISPPIMPGWDGYDVRGHFASRYNAPTWVDNDVNVMALGELRDGLARGIRDMVYVKVGSGIGAGLISGGRLHRGAQGCAGDIGHVAAADDSSVLCRCGQVGCLEALAGGAALARDGALAALNGTSPFLHAIDPTGQRITASDVGRGGQSGDVTCVRLITDSARLLGESLSRMVNFFNPALILIGGGVTGVGDRYLATVRQVVLTRSLPLATRSLLIDRSPLGNTAGLKGAAFMVIDELLSQERLGLWIGDRTPAGRPSLADEVEATVV